LIEHNEFDLVILAMMMPTISNFEVIKDIRKKYSLYELPIMFLTAKTSDNDIQKGFRAGANDYITKPIKNEELLARIETQLKIKESIKLAFLIGQEKEQRKIAENLNQFNKILNENLYFDVIIEKVINIAQNIFSQSQIIYLKKFENKFIFEKSNNQNNILNSISIDKEDIVILSSFFKEKKFFLDSRLKFISKLKNNNNQFLCFPLENKNELYGIFLIILDISIEIDEYNYDFQLIRNFISQSSLIIQNSILFEKTTKQKIELEDMLNKILTLEKFLTIIYSEKDTNKAISYLLIIFIKGLKISNKIAFLKKESTFYELIATFSIQDFEFENLLNLEYSEMIFNFDKLIQNNRMKFGNFKLNSSKIDNVKKDSFFIESSGLNNSLNFSTPFAIKVFFNENTYGVIILEKYDANFSDNYKLFELFLNNFSIYLDKKSFGQERLKLEEKKEFRCKNCNKLFFSYKGVADFVEIKCSRCNTYNYIKDE